MTRLLTRPVPPVEVGGPWPRPALDGLGDAPRGFRLRSLLPLVPTLVGLALWWIGIHDVDGSRMSDFGLISVLPVTVLAAPVLVTLGFCLSLGQRTLRVPLVLAHVVALIFILYGSVPLMEPVPHYKILYRHAGIIDYISHHGSVDGTIDAYFNWPGFFAFVSFLLHVAGLDSALSLGPWAPVFFNLLYLGPLLMLLGTTPRRRLVWLAIWFFYLSNWIGQDYLAPQALAYFSYLVVLAVVVRWFASRPVGSRMVATRFFPRSAEGRKTALMFVVVLVFIGIVPSHQLTPFAILAGVLALAVFRQCRARGLIVLMGVTVVGWIAFMTTAYLAGHMDVLTGNIGKVNQNAAANVVERLKGSPDHQVIVWWRMIATGVLWAAAALGWFLRLRRGHRDHAFVLLALATFPLIGLQPYGGEIVLRVFLFSLPFMAFFAASLFNPRGGVGEHWRALLAIGVVCLVLTTSFFFTRYGNLRVDFFTKDEAAAVDALYRLAPPGAFFLGGSDDLPWKAVHYDAYTYEWVRRPRLGPVTAETVALESLDLLREHREKGAFFIVTRSQHIDVDTFGSLPPGSLDRVEELVRSAPGARLVYDNPDARIYSLTSGGSSR